MSAQIIKPKIRSFICLTAHPEGCAANVRKLVEAATAERPPVGFKNVLVLGGSTGYGLASLITAVFGYGANAVSVCLERAPREETPASAGYYNLCEVGRLARERGKKVQALNIDAFSTEAKQQVVSQLKQSFGKVDLVVYSLAAPKRIDPATGVTYASALKPIGAPYNEKAIQVDKGQVVGISVPVATEAEIFATTKVMGGEDWALWMDALLDAELVAPGCRTVAYSYVGPRITDAIYRSGTLGRAKEHLEKSAYDLDAKLQQAVGGHAWVSVQQALVTQASAAIPVLPLYISLLLKIMQERNLTEGTGEQINRLFRDHLALGKTPQVDSERRIRLDDQEMDRDLQSVLDGRWEELATENLNTIADFDGYKRAFRQLFGFEVPGVDYDAPTEVLRSLDG